MTVPVSIQGMKAIAPPLLPVERQAVVTPDRRATVQASARKSR